MLQSQSVQLFERAKKSIPGGVNSPVRAFKSVGGTPIFMDRADGAYLYDADGNAFVDFINSWGPMILGHLHPSVVVAIRAKAEQAISFGAPTMAEIEMAELMIKMVGHIDMVRLVSSGTEACMTALRIARGFTNRNKLIKFEGCYHGHADAFLVKAGSGLATFDIQTVPGITGGVSTDTLTAPYNNIEAVSALIDQHPEQIAAIIVEPVAGNMGCVPPKPEFISGLRQLCTQHGIVLIFDEVMTGFRLSAGGAAQRLGIEADLYTYGKVIGGGMPVGAIAGQQQIMEQLAPVGKVYQAGTLSGNPLAVAAGFATLNYLHQHPDVYKKIDETTEKIHIGIGQILTEKGIEHTVNRFGSMISLHFGANPVTDFKTASETNIELFNKFFHHMLANGVYLPPSAYETWFVSMAITDSEINKTFEAVRKF